MKTPEVDTTGSVYTYCYFDPHSLCENGLETPDHKLCAKCVADSFAEVVRTKSH